MIILGVGQIQKRKGLDDFIQLAKDNPQWKFIWAGGFSFGKITDGYADYEKVYKNPPKNLFFPGIVDRETLVDYYNIATIFLLPSYNELFPMSILEAFNCGTPVMVRELELYQSVIEGFYIGCKDRADMQQKIAVLDSDRPKLAQWRQASQRAAQKYSERAVAKLWYNYYMTTYKKYRS